MSVPAAPPPFGHGSLLERYGRHINRSVPRFLEKLGLAADAGEGFGATVTDGRGRRFVDCVGGYGLANVGHNHPSVVAALRRALDARPAPPRPFVHRSAVELAERLAALSPPGLTCSFLCTSGSEAVDSALKLARLVTGRPGIVAAQGSFHGVTFGALSATGIPAFRRLFEPLVPGVSFVPYGDADALAAAVSERTAALLLEPIQHEAGVSLPPPGYLAAARAVCSHTGAQLILDEVKTGLGRTGPLFACLESGVVPDILLIGKSLGGGLVPSGAVLARPGLWSRFGLSFPMSASTYSWNPLACYAGLAVLEILTASGFLEQAAARAAAFLEQVNDLVRRWPGLAVDVRGKGFLMSLALRDPRVAAGVSSTLAERGVLGMPAFGNAAHLMLEPPLVVSEEELAEVANALDGALAAITAQREKRHADL